MAGKPDTLYVPYFAPDEPDTKSGSSDVYTNNYLKDTALATVKKGTLLHPSFQDFQLLQGDTAKYSGTATKTGTQSGGMGYKYGPNAGCELAPLLRLSSDTASVKTAISKMVANGNTDIPFGLEWGWNVLSPVGPFADGKPYDDQEWEKYVVLMTDGNNRTTTRRQRPRQVLLLRRDLYLGRAAWGSPRAPRRSAPPSATSGWARSARR